MGYAAAVLVKSCELARGVDSKCIGAATRSGERIVDGGVSASAVEEAVREAAAVGIPSGDLAGVVDGLCIGCDA